MTTQSFAEQYNALYHYVLKRIGSADDAQDLVQDVFVKLSKTKLDKIGNLKSWLFAVTRNAIIDYYRTKRKEINVLEDNFIEELQDENRAVSELSSCIVPFIENLPEDYRTLIMLSEIEGYSQKEIAEQLGMNYVTVRSKVQRGRAKLKEMFLACCSIEQSGKGSIVGFENRNNCC